MADREYVVPPLIAATIAMRDACSWGSPTVVSPEVSYREATTPHCNTNAMRFTVSIPDVHATVFAQLFNFDDEGNPNSEGGTLTRFELPESFSMQPRHRHRSGSHSHRSEAGESSFPRDGEDSTGHHAGVEVDLSEGLVAAAAVGHDRVKLAHVITQCGGFDDGPACPTWFPALPVSPQCPYDHQSEVLFHFRMGLPVPGMKDRDFAGRLTRIVDASSESPVVKEAIGSTSEELFVAAFASSGDVLPAFRDCTRGATASVLVVQGPGNGRLGVVADLFWLAEPLTNALGQTAFRRELYQDHLHMVKFARMLQAAFPRPVALNDRGLMDAALTLAREIRRRRFGDRGAGSDLGVGCSGSCAVQ